jgi:SpoVK/Ycf46/Vps4 family AAA+-type ATPase
MIAGWNKFYDEGFVVKSIGCSPLRNAMGHRSFLAIVFIDDADVTFGGEKESGLYRYLLTKVGNLESASSGRVCVMMTAMEPSDLPAAIPRSGRVELWRETRLPDDAARAEIFRARLASLPPPLCAADIEVLSAASRGCTGADLKIRAVFPDGRGEDHTVF